jgi:large subunit ribosomal protein L10
MNRTEKQALVENLTNEFREASALVVTDFKGMTVQQLEDLRNQARESDVKVQVVKNTLAKLALDGAEKTGLELKDNNLFIWGDDLVTLAKVVTKYDDKSPDTFSIKAGHFEGEAVDPSKIEAYSKLASREEFLGMLLSTWTAPLRNIMYVWSANAREFVTVLDAVKQQKEEAGA